MSADFYYVYVKKQLHSVEHQMQAWCEQQCEGLFTHHYVSWQLQGWYFTHESDAIQFRLTWHDHVATDTVAIW